MVTCEIRQDKPGFVAMEAVESACKKIILDLARGRVKASHTVGTGGLPE